MAPKVILNDQTEKRIALVYNSESGTYEAFDFNKIDDIETILRRGGDAFGRQRISEPYTLADYSHVYGEETELLTKTSGTNSNISFNVKQAKAILTVGSGINNYTIHQSRMYHHYMPGKSQLTFQSFKFGSANSGVNKKIGLFDDYNGIYFQQSGDGTLQIVLRSSVSGSVQEEIINQSNWNIDTCNGSGDSKFNININNTELFSADFQWLGVGRVRAGFVHNGEAIVAHEFYNSNNRNTVYWSNPNLPVRCEIRNYATTTGLHSMDQICATVISEGGYKEAGVDFAIRPSGRTIAANAVNFPLIAIRLKTGYYGEPNRSIVRIGNVNLLSLDQNVAYEVWRLTGSASISGGSWVSANNESVIEYNSTATSGILTSGLMFDAGFVLAGGQGAGKYGGVTQSQDITNARRGYISQNIDSTDSNIFVIFANNLTSTATTGYATMQWRETR